MILLTRLLLRLMPAAFRAQYQDEIAALVRDERAAPCYQGLTGRIRFACYLASDIVVASARLQRRRFARVPQPPQPRERSEMETIIQDLRYALRQFVRRPGFTAIAVASLGLAIGGNTLIYGMLDGFVFRPFPYPDPDRLVAVGVTFPKISSETNYVEAISPAEYLEIRENRSFLRAGSFDLGNRNISGGDVPERVFTALLLDDLFPVVGLAPALGRGFTAEELGPNGPPAAIISHRLWQTRFGGDPAILNRAIRISGQATSVVGVMPPGLVLIGTDLWIPWGGDPLKMPRNVRQFNVLARLAPGASLAEANAELQTIAGRVEQSHKAEFAEYENWRITATPWAAALMRDVRPAAFILLGAVGLVLLIACANLANLFLARASTRHRELAVRLALGAARWRLTRLLLTESLLLAFAGAAAGLVVVWFGLKGAGALIPGQFRMLGLEAGINARVLVWSLALAALCALLVGLLPAIQAMRTDPHDSLKGDVRSGGSRRGRHVRHALVVAELALSVVLLLGAGLLMRSFINVQRVDRGFDPKGVLTMRLTLPRDRYPGEAVNAFFDRLTERLSELPGVTSVAASSQFPPSAMLTTQFRLEGGTVDGQTLPNAVVTTATPSYFATLGVPLRAGRSFNATDRLESPRVVLINQAFAARYLPGSDPVGQRVRLGSPDRLAPPATIVGVVADYRNNGMTQPPRPEIFVPVRQQTAWNQLFMLIRTEGAPTGVLAAARQTVQSLDAEQPVYLIQTLEDAVALSSFQQRISTVLLSIFAGVALVLAAIGIYGVMSYAVSQRTQEMGVRLAIGAQRRDVMWLVISHVLKLSAIGLALGIAVLFVAAGAVEGLLFGIHPADPATIAVVTLTLGAVALAAAWGPASRASRVDPIEALRYE